MGTKTFRTPITVHDGKQYVAPGSEVTMDEADADRFIAQHGEYGGANVPADPANTQTLNVMDEKSLADLNTQAAINGGHGKNAPTLNQRANTVTGDPSRHTAKDPLPSDAELEAMNKAEILELAHTRNVALESNPTKAEAIAALKASK